MNKCSISFVCHILDDFLIIEPASALPPYSQICQESLTSMLLSFKSLNIPIATDKTAGPTRVIEFTGIILDSDSMEARLPPDKVSRILESLFLPTQEVLYIDRITIAHRNSKFCLQGCSPGKTLPTADDRIDTKCQATSPPHQAQFRFFQRSHHVAEIYC